MEDIPMSLEDLQSPVDSNELKRLLKRPNYARAFLFMAIRFVNQKANHLTVIEVARAIQRARSQTQEILQRFVHVGCINNSREGSRIFFTPKEADMFNEYWTIAKETLDGEANRIGQETPSSPQEDRNNGQADSEGIQV